MISQSSRNKMAKLPHTNQRDGDCKRKGVFNFLGLPRELRDEIYIYATPYTKPLASDHTSMIHLPTAVQAGQTFETRDSKTRLKQLSRLASYKGMLLVCRQIYEEYCALHTRPSRVCLDIPNVDDFFQTFLNRKDIMVEEVRIMDRFKSFRSHHWWNPPLLFTPPIFDILPLIELRRRSPAFMFLFWCEKEYSWECTILNNFLDHIANLPFQHLELRDQPAMIRSEALEIAHGNSLPALLHVYFAQHTWPNVGQYGVEKNALALVFDAHGAPSWMRGQWMYTHQIEAWIMGYVAGEVPEKAIDLELAACMNLMSLLKSFPVRGIERIWIGTVDHAITKAKLLVTSNEGWVWNHEEEEDDEESEYNGESECDEESEDSEHDEGHKEIETSESQSRASSHETWSARLDDRARLDNPYWLTILEHLSEGDEVDDPWRTVLENLSGGFLGGLEDPAWGPVLEIVLEIMYTCLMPIRDWHKILEEVLERRRYEESPEIAIEDSSLESDTKKLIREELEEELRLLHNAPRFSAHDPEFEYFDQLEEVITSRKNLDLASSSSPQDARLSC